VLAVATANHTTSTSVAEDRDAFGNWLGGFVAGEGSFILSMASRRRPTPYAKFVIALRDDDRPILEEIRDFFGCGTLHSRIHKGDNPQFRLVVSRAEDLMATIVPFFERYPIRAKKRRDFPIWARGVELVYRVACRPMSSLGHRGFRTRWTDREIAEFLAIAGHLNGQRRYGAPETAPPAPTIVVPRERVLPLFD
jgi:hypothetical protein